MLFSLNSTSVLFVRFLAVYHPKTLFRINFCCFPLPCIITSKVGVNFVKRRFKRVSALIDEEEKKFVLESCRESFGLFRVNLIKEKKSI